MPATDAFPIVFMFHYIYIHFACMTAFLTANTFFRIYPDFKKRYFVKQRVDGAKWADPLTEWTVKQNAQDDYKHKDCKLKRK